MSKYWSKFGRCEDLRFRIVSILKIVRCSRLLAESHKEERAYFDVIGKKIGIMGNVFLYDDN